MVPVITIDGPGGSGKGAISKLLAEKLGWRFLDSGAVYRTFSLVVTEKHIQLNDVDRLVNEVNDLKVEFINQPAECQKVLLEHKDITDAIRSEECGVMASKIAAIPAVRLALIPCLQSFCRLPGLIAEGRDMGTVIFPNAWLKIFLTASIQERARRRLLQLQGIGTNVTFDATLRSLIKRDTRDQCRIAAPLKPDPAAMIIDTTKLSINEVLQAILEHVQTLRK